MHPSWESFSRQRWMSPPSATLRCTSPSWSGIRSDTDTQEKYQAGTVRKYPFFCSALLETVHMWALKVLPSSIHLSVQICGIIHLDRSCLFCHRRKLFLWICVCVQKCDLPIYTFGFGYKFILVYFFFSLSMLLHPGQTPYAAGPREQACPCQLSPDGDGVCMPGWVFPPQPRGFKIDPSFPPIPFFPTPPVCLCFNETVNRCSSQAPTDGQSRPGSVPAHTRAPTLLHVCSWMSLKREEEAEENLTRGRNRKLKETRE